MVSVETNTKLFPLLSVLFLSEKSLVLSVFQLFRLLSAWRVSWLLIEVFNPQAPLLTRAALSKTVSVPKHPQQHFVCTGEFQTEESISSFCIFNWNWCSRRFWLVGCGLCFLTCSVPCTSLQSGGFVNGIWVKTPFQCRMLWCSFQKYRTLSWFPLIWERRNSFCPHLNDGLIRGLSLGRFCYAVLHLNILLYVKKWVCKNSEFWRFWKIAVDSLVKVA